MSKPPFDPNQPFDAGTKPTFDPSQPFSTGDQSASASQVQPPNAMESSTPYSDIWNQPNVGVGSKIWDSMAVPAQTASKVLNVAANAVPEGTSTGNVPWDVATGTPKVIANTVAQALPGFVSRGAMLTAGAAKGLQAVAPLTDAIGGMAAKAGEGISGAIPGSVRSAWNDASTMFSQGKKAAQPLYEAAKQEIPEGASIFSGLWKPADIIKAGQEYLAKGGQMEPAEAFTFRRALGVAADNPNNIPDELYKMKDAANVVAKQSPNIAQADPLYQKGLYGQSLRNILPVNKSGSTSVMRGAMMAGISKLGMLGKVASVGMSPAAIGTAATIGGLATRPIGAVATNPLLMNLIQQYMSKFYGNGTTNQDAVYQSPPQAGVR